MRRRLGAWLHVDGAYGGAGLAAPSVRDRFAGIEHADSFIVDPHKWLFAPFDCCALVYRDPAIARAAHTQHAEYLDVLHGGADDVPTPSGTPATTPTTCPAGPAGCRSGSAWPRTAPTPTATRSRRRCAVTRARGRADRRRRAHLELVMEPELSACCCSAASAGTPPTTRRGATGMLAEGTAFVTPTSWNGETVLRLCIVNPLTTVDDLARSSSTGAGLRLSADLVDPQRVRASLAHARRRPRASWPAVGGHHRRAGRRAVGDVGDRHRRRPTMIDAAECLVTPGSINTHHHLFQNLTRAYPPMTDKPLFGWLQSLYPLWRALDTEAVYLSAWVGLAELALCGCTTSTDHLYLHPRGAGDLLSAEIDAARDLGVRFHPTRGLDVAVAEGRRAAAR